jgi:hypothetical protein
LRKVESNAWSPEFSDTEEKDLLHGELNDLTRRDLGYTVYQVHMAAFVFAENRILKINAEIKKMPVNIGSRLLKKEYLLISQNLRGVIKGERERMERNDLENYFELVKEITKEF